MEFPDDSMMNKTTDVLETSVGAIAPNDGDNKESGGSGAISETVSAVDGNNNLQAPLQIQASLDDSVVSGSSGIASKGGPGLPGEKKKKKKKKKKVNTVSDE
jgi:hypothetical protein